MKIEELELSVRTSNVLRNARIETLEQLKAADLRVIPGIGARCRREIQEMLQHLSKQVDPHLWEWVLLNKPILRKLQLGQAHVYERLTLRD